MDSYHILRYFAYSHLPANLQKISEPFGRLANEIAERDSEGNDPRNPETEVALRKLLEAKDAAVRAAL